MDCDRNICCSQEYNGGCETCVCNKDSKTVVFKEAVIGELNRIVRKEKGYDYFEGLKTLLNLISMPITKKNELFWKQFSVDPASTKYHGNRKHGLIRHSSSVARQLMRYEACGLAYWERPESPVIIGLLHDICKVGTYRESGGEYTYNKGNEVWKGHATKSLALISTELFKGFKLTEQEALCIRYHMGPYETEEWNEYRKAIEAYPEVLFTHTADMYSTHCLNL